jgi:TrmH family RNA methyltransferase
VRPPSRVTSRGNPLLARIRRLARDPAAYRGDGEVWVEGEHLCRAARDRQWAVAHAVLGETAFGDPGLRSLADAARSVTVVPDALFASTSALASPASIGFLLPLPAGPARPAPGAPSLVLDRIQDPGNAGSILRSAAAFGIGQVLALAGTAALWSPKVMRAAMGAHFGLRLVESLDAAALDALQVPLVATSPHAEHAIDDIALPWPCAWVLGHEGQGVGEPLQRRCSLAVRIPQPGGEESLNVAAAAAVCLYESDRQRRAAGLSTPSGPA